MTRVAPLETSRKRTTVVCIALVVLGAACGAVDTQPSPAAVHTPVAIATPAPVAASSPLPAAPTTASTPTAASPTPPPAIYTSLAGQLGDGAIATATLDPPSDLSCAGWIRGTGEQALGGLPDAQSIPQAFARFIANTSDSGLPDSGYVAHVTSATTVTVTWTELSTGDTLVRVTIINESDDPQGLWIIETFSWCGRALEVRSLD